MGMLLSVPMFVIGLVLVIRAPRRASRRDRAEGRTRSTHRAQGGPLPVSRYMALCWVPTPLAVTWRDLPVRPAISPAPEISQMFDLSASGRRPCLAGHGRALPLRLVELGARRWW